MRDKSELNVIELFRGLEPTQARRLAELIKETLPGLREEVIETSKAQKTISSEENHGTSE
ncbi:MAG: hypothetical protein ABSG01_10000 [Anaerolineales bacterium]|jgi:hypothetical protein